LRSLGASADLASQGRFSEFRLKSLGPTANDIAQCTFDFNQINIVTNPHALERIEARFKDQAGRSLQGLLVAEANSRVLVEVESKFPQSRALTNEAITWLDSLTPWTGSTTDHFDAASAIWIISA
jgi:hypothetical protein